MNNSRDRHSLHTTHPSKNDCPTDGDNGGHQLRTTRKTVTLQLQIHPNHPAPTSSAPQGPSTPMGTGLQPLTPVPQSTTPSCLNLPASDGSSPGDPTTDAPTWTPSATPAHTQTSTKRELQAIPSKEPPKPRLKMTRPASPTATCPSGRWPTSSAGTAPLANN